MANLLINVVATHRSTNSYDLLLRVRAITKRLSAAQPLEIAVDNVGKRVLGLIHDAAEGGKVNLKSNSSNVNGTTSNDDVGTPSGSTIKEDVLDGIRELLDELDQADKQISEYASEQVYPGETILIVGASRTIQKFLLDAARRRKFNILLVENYPQEHEIAHQNIINGAVRDSEEPVSAQNRLKSFTAAGLSVTIISDAQAFAMMPLVSKVILSAQGIFSNGGCTLVCGSKGIASIAKLHHVPVLILGAIYRLNPSIPFDSSLMMERSEPSKNNPFRDGRFVEEIEVPHFELDYIPPELLSLYITNM